MYLSSNGGFKKYRNLFSDPYGEDETEDRDHRFYEDGDDAGFFVLEHPGVWSCHYLCRSRGRAALTATRNVLREFFENEDATLIYGLIKDEHRPAKILTRLVGFTSYGKVSYPEGDYELFILFKKDFMNG